MKIVLSSDFLDKAHGSEEFRKSFMKFCEMNNFKYEEILYLISIMNFFCHVNEPHSVKNENNH